MPRLPKVRGCISNTMRHKISRSTYIIIALGIVVVGFGAVLFVVGQHNFEVTTNPTPSKVATSSTSNNNTGPISISAGSVDPITGTSCAHEDARPIAVMLSGDTVTRPLSGIGEADMVVEMQVVLGGISRYMAVFGCQEPGEIGSVRSAREGYIPLAQGLDAIYAHWGGSHFALDDLRKGIIDNINALADKYRAYFRKPGIPEPHNGFTSYARLATAARKMGYRLTSRSPVYPHEPAPVIDSSTPAGTLRVPYPGEFKVTWHYDPVTNLYSRFRGGTAEIDKNTGKQVTASVVVVLKTDIREKEGQYDSVRVVGQGSGAIYQDGKIIPIKWRKPTATARLMFMGQDDKEAALSPGQIWISYVALGVNATYNATTR